MWTILSKYLNRDTKLAHGLERHEETRPPSLTFCPGFKGQLAPEEVLEGLHGVMDGDAEEDGK